MKPPEKKIRSEGRIEKPDEQRRIHSSKQADGLDWQVAGGRAGVGAVATVLIMAGSGSLGHGHQNR